MDYWPGKSPPPPTAADGDDGDNNNEQSTMEEQLQLQIEKQELEKWVKRSTKGAVVMMTLFVAWIITFQVNKEHFGSGWFVMDPTDAEITGW